MIIPTNHEASVGTIFFFFYLLYSATLLLAIISHLSVLRLTKYKHLSCLSTQEM